MERLDPGDLMLAKRANAMLELAQVTKKDNVLIIADFGKEWLGRALVSQANVIGANGMMMLLPPLGGDHYPVPKSVHDMAMHSDVIMTVLSTLIAHTPLRTESLRKGLRFMVLDKMSPEFLNTGAFDIDFHATRAKCDAMAAKLQQARTARVTSSAGTDLRMSLEGRDSMSLSGFAVPGTLACPPGMEALCSPVEGSAEGRIICDMSIAGLPKEVSFNGHLLKEPIELTVHQGLVKEVKGGAEAREIAALYASMDDPNVYNIAELGVGMNPFYRQFTGDWTDESVVGGIHIGTGENWCFPGGKIQSKLHIDFVQANVTVELDGEAVIKNGKQLI